MVGDKLAKARFLPTLRLFVFRNGTRQSFAGKAEEYARRKSGDVRYAQPDINFP